MIEFLDPIIKVVAVARDVSSVAGNSGLVAMVAVAETLLSAERSALIGSLERLREAGLKKLEAGANKAVAEAADGANRAISKRHAREMERLAEAEKRAGIRKLEAEAAKAEGAARKEHAEAEIAEANAARAAWQQQADGRLFKALARYGLEGGSLNADVEALRKLIGAQSRSAPAEATSQPPLQKEIRLEFAEKTSQTVSASGTLETSTAEDLGGGPYPEPPPIDTKPA